MTLLAAIIAVALAGGPVTTPYGNFEDAYYSGADCARLFELRDLARKDSTKAQIKEMDTKLAVVGCDSPTSTRRAEGQVDSNQAFTVKEYRIYRYITDRPGSIGEDEAIRRASSRFKIELDKVRGTVDKVKQVLDKNKWHAKPEAEIRHASDWKGEKR